MAHAASAASRAHLVGELSRNRSSSPYVDNTFATATSTSFRNALHSTPQKQEHTATRDHLPLHYDQMPSPGSAHSEEMSIEIGRGVKRSSRLQEDDISSHALFNLGDEHSGFDMTGTPPAATRNTLRRSDGGLRKEASLRRATDSAKATREQKRTISGVKQRATSDNFASRSAEQEDYAGALDLTNPTVTLNARPSRFTSARNASKSTHQTIPTRFSSGQGLTDAQHSPARPIMNNNVTVQSTTFTANQSFMLPDLPNITELVSGIRKDGTPVFNRATKSRSRFTSAAYRAHPPSYLPVNSLPVPDDEKAIFASLQLLKDRVTQLEAENSEAHKRAEEYVNEIIDLRSQLEVNGQHPESAFGSEEDSHGPRPPHMASNDLRVKNKSLQERLDRSERKLSVAEITVKRVTNERDALIAQIGNAYFCNEELTKENEEFRESHSRLQGEIEDLKAEVEELRNGNERLRLKLARAKISQSKKTEKDVIAEQPAHKEEEDLAERENRRKESVSLPVHKGRSKKEALDTASSSHRRSKSQTDDAAVYDLASRIEVEIQKRRDQAAADNAQVSGYARRQSTSRSRSQSRRRQSGDAELAETVNHKRRVSSSATEAPLSEPESTTTLNVTQGTRRADTRASSSRRASVYDADNNLVELSGFDSRELAALANLRQRLEEELRAKRAKEREQDATTRSVNNQPTLTRKSSLKDVTGRVHEGTGIFSIDVNQIRNAKSVRLQSPHSSDAMSFVPHDDEQDTGDISVLSNTSRRRRRAASVENDTSAFIIPDITLRGTGIVPEPSAADASPQTCIAHNAASCTLCHSSTASIPTPVPVSDRDLDLTSATIRPSQPPALALATVIKHLEDEIVHLKLQREHYNRLYNQHDPALSRRRRLATKTKIEQLTAEIEKRSDQVYALYDVLEGQKASSEGDPGLAKGKEEVKEMTQKEVDDTLTSVGIHPAELAGRISRGVPPPAGMDDMESDSGLFEDEDLPWEGISSDDEE